MAPPASSLAGGEIRFRIDGGERAQAERIAARIGMSVNDAMKLMLKRFIVEGGLPFPMRDVAHEHASSERLMPIHGVTHGRLGEIASNAAREADLAHVRAGRLPPVAELDSEADADARSR
jgi:addiction module RelB/DinJ family antitoxin